MKTERELLEQIFIIMFSAFRYALGRRTYVVSVIADTLKHNWSTLHPTQREMFKREIQEAIDGDRAGDKYDAAEWRMILTLED